MQKFSFLFLGWGEVEYLSTTGGNGLLYQPLMTGERLGWITIVRKNPK
jgi:hypothetical protein